MARKFFPCTVTLNVDNIDFVNSQSSNFSGWIDALITARREMAGSSPERKQQLQELQDKIKHLQSLDEIEQQNLLKKKQAADLETTKEERRKQESINKLLDVIRSVFTKDELAKIEQDERESYNKVFREFRNRYPKMDVDERSALLNRETFMQYIEMVRNG